MAKTAVADLKDETFYRKRSINDLIILAAHLFAERGETYDFEKLVYECFSLFPGVFGFQRYKKWPDARKFDRPLRDLKEKNLIEEGAQGYLSLTKQGKKRAQEIALSFKQKKLLFSKNR